MTSPALATVQLLGAVVAIALASYAYRHRDRPGVIWLVAVLFGNTVWMVAAGINYATGSTTVSTAMLQVRYVGITVIPVALLFFALSYTGTDEWLGRRRQLLIASPAAGALALALTDHVHGLFYAGVTPASNPNRSPTSTEWSRCRGSPTRSCSWWPPRPSSFGTRRSPTVSTAGRRSRWPASC